MNWKGVVRIILFTCLTVATVSVALGVTDMRQPLSAQQRKRTSSTYSHGFPLLMSGTKQGILRHYKQNSTWVGSPQLFAVNNKDIMGIVVDRGSGGWVISAMIYQRKSQSSADWTLLYYRDRPCDAGSGKFVQNGKRTIQFVGPVYDDATNRYADKVVDTIRIW